MHRAKRNNFGMSLDTQGTNNLGFLGWYGGYPEHQGINRVPKHGDNQITVRPHIEKREEPGDQFVLLSICEQR